MEQLPSQNLIMEPEKWMASLEKGDSQFLETVMALGSMLNLGRIILNGWLVQGFLSKESWRQGKMSRINQNPQRVC